MREAVVVLAFALAWSVLAGGLWYFMLFRGFYLRVMARCATN